MLSRKAAQEGGYVPMDQERAQEAQEQTDGQVGDSGGD